MDAFLLTVTITCLCAGSVLAVLADAATGAGYIVAFAMSGFGLGTLRQLRLARDIAQSVDILKIENGVLRQNNREHEKQNSILRLTNVELAQTSTRLERNVDMLAKSIKMVGETNTDFVNRLTGVYDRLCTENKRHAQLIVQQARLHLRSLFMHVDVNHSFALSAEELIQYREIFTESFPTLNWDELLKRAQQGDVGVAQIESLIASLHV